MKTISADPNGPFDWQLRAVLYARSMLPENMGFAGGREDLSRPIVFVVYCIYVGQRLILVDPGCDALPGFEMQDHIPPVDALEKAGISADAVTDVIITHAHHDHIDAVRHFPNATVHIQQDEYIAGREYIPNSCHLNVFRDSTLLADVVQVQRVGGHTAGSCAVMLPDKAFTWVLCADECYFEENLSKQIPIGTAKNPENSIRFMKELINKPYKVLICHDPDNLEKEFAYGGIAGV